MAASISPQVLPEEAVVITLLGRKYVFANREEAKAWMQRPMSQEERDSLRQAAASFEKLRVQILKETNGRGIRRQDVDDALAEARDH